MGIAYVVGAWLLIQVADILLDNIGSPPWVLQTFFAALTVGFFITLFFAWAFELTPEGIKKEKDVDRSQSITSQTGRKLDFFIIGVLVLALGYFVWESRFADQIPVTPEAGVDTLVPDSGKTVAVLPFVNLSANPEQEYFVDGLTEEILNSLSRLPELKVTARTSAFYFKGKKLPVSEIAETLGVEHIVEGSVRRSDDALRVTAQLIRASDGFHLWSEAYDGTAEQVFHVQEEIAENIAKALDIFLDDDKRNTMFAAGTRSVPAFEAFLKGRELYDRGHQVFSPQDRWKANEYLEESLRLDPEFSAAYSLHHDAYAHFLMQDMPAAKPGLMEEQALARIRFDFAEATRYARDQRLRLATLLSGAIFNESWNNVPDAVAELEAFVEAGRVEIRGPGWSHMLLVSIGRADLGLRRALNEIRYDPLDPLSYANASGAALALEDFEGALDFVQQGYLLSPDHTFLRRTEAMAMALSGRVDAGARKLLTIGGEGFYQTLALAMLGERKQALQLAAEAERARPRDGSPIWVYAQLGEAAQVTRLTRSIDAAPIGMLSFLRLIYYSGGSVPFDLDAAPNFRVRLREAGADPAALRPWVPLIEKATE